MSASLPLIVDPELIAASYTGSSVDQRGFTATFDRLGTVYTGGSIYGNSTGQYVPTLNAMQDTNQGLWDISITRFNSSGTDVLYFTYLGGGAADHTISSIVHPSGDLVLYGVTASK